MKFTIDLDLTPKKIELLNKLEVNTKTPKEVFIKELINEETTWEDLADYNYILEREKEANLKFLNKEEANAYLVDHLFLNKQSHDLQI